MEQQGSIHANVPLDSARGANNKKQRQHNKNKDSTTSQVTGD